MSLPYYAPGAALYGPGVPGQDFGSGPMPLPIAQATNVAYGQSVQKQMNKLDVKYFLARRSLINAYLKSRAEQEGYLAKRACPPCESKDDLGDMTGFENVFGALQEDSSDSDDTDTDTESASTDSEPAAAPKKDDLRADVARSSKGGGRKRRSRRRRHRHRRSAQPFEILDITHVLRNPFHFLLLNQIDNALADQLIWLRNRQIQEVKAVMAKAGVEVASS